MTLSVKLALLTSLGFIFGMSWLVSNVARPIVEMPTPLIARGPDRVDATDPIYANTRGTMTPTGRGSVVLANHFENSSVIEEVKRDATPFGDALIVADVSAFDRQLPPELPPLFIPEAPVVAFNDEPVPAGEPEVGTFATETYEPVVAGTSMDGPSSGGLQMLAALRPEADTSFQESDIKGSVSPARQYVVRRGDSLAKIMKREWNRTDDKSLRILLAANPEVAKRRNKIFPGEVLNIPSPRQADAVSLVGLTDEVASSLAGQPDASVGFSWYTIKKRDSLASIARRHLKDPNRWREIAQLNQLQNVNKILPGMRIKLPTARMDT